MKIIINGIPDYRRLFALKQSLKDIQNRGFSVKRNGKYFIIEENDSEINNIYQIRIKGSDLLTFRQVIISEEYRPLINIVQSHKIQVKTIIDAGTNIGMFSLCMCKYFSDPIIYAIEPEQGNFQMLLNNIKINKKDNIVPINAGVWNKNEKLEISNNFRDKSNWSFQTKPADRQRNVIQGITFDYLIKERNIQNIDILKIDIEGAEKQIFEHYPMIRDILRITNIIAIEIHEEVVNPETIKNILINNSFSIFNVGQTTFAIRK